MDENIFIQSTGFTYINASEKLMEYTNLKIRSIGLWALARFTLTDEIILSTGRVYTRHQLCIDSILCDPTNSNPYVLLGNMLSPFFTIVRPSKIILSGIPIRKRQLYLKAIHLDPNNLSAYIELSKMMFDCEVQRLIDGREFNRCQLLAIVIDRNPSCYHAYVLLGRFIGFDKSIELLDGTIVHRLQLFQRAVQNNPHLSNAYNEIANWICQRAYKSRISNILISVPVNGVLMNTHDLFLKSLECDPSQSEIRNKLKSISNRKWSRKTHFLGIEKVSVNILLSTLFLGFQKLENLYIIPQAHQAMFEDMLELYF